ncbi:hypothetical protein [Algihabitans albus]|uniref:hypothetical protein n=1 Tax=Algihabitans albus TaxID=2164067 RepID=UPI000E5D9EF5|nr:hypothetical protein [Algihabitans albus]
MSGALLLSSATPALAYIGPGGGLSALGAILALFAAAGLALVGFVWFPIKRMRAARHKARQQHAGASDGPGHKN